MGDEFIAGLTIFFMFGTPLVIAVLVFFGWSINNSRKLWQADKARESFERLAAEKLDVMKTAIAMGYDDEHIKELDSRLERLVGASNLAKMLDLKDPHKQNHPSELLDSDLAREVDRIKNLKNKQGN